LGKQIENVWFYELFWKINCLNGRNRKRKKKKKKKKKPTKGARDGVWGHDSVILTRDNDKRVFESLTRENIKGSNESAVLDEIWSVGFIVERSERCRKQSLLS